MLVPHGEPPGYFTYASLTALGVPHVITTRHCPGIGASGGANSPFARAATEVLALGGLEMGRAAWVRQVHGADVARADARGGFAGLADALVTTVPGVPLAIFTADCLAIVLVDLQAPAVAVAHVGWRGTVRGAVQAAAAALIDAGARPERIHAAISPSIGPCCYEVDAPVIEAFSAAYPDGWRSWVTPAADAEHWMLDLWAANTMFLEQAGVDPARIENPRACTACHVATFYSYRKGHQGRLATIAALPQADEKGPSAWQ